MTGSAYIQGCIFRIFKFGYTAGKEVDMSLYIRDDEVDALARQLQSAIKAPTKTEAVRIALKRELERTNAVLPLRERIKKFQDAASALGPRDPNFDMKKFMDEGWGEPDVP
jgi:antitoxin VapB